MELQGCRVAADVGNAWSRAEGPKGIWRGFHSNHDITSLSHLGCRPDLGELAARHGLTSYDAAYLDLAVRLQLPLATQDDALSKAAAATGVTLLES